MHKEYFWQIEIPQLTGPLFMIGLAWLLTILIDCIRIWPNILYCIKNNTVFPVKLQKRKSEASQNCYF